MAHESFEDADDRGGDEPAVREREGRPRGAARRRRRSTWTRCRRSPASGGWPMTVFLTPDGRPFFGGTYFPPADRQRHARVPADHGRGRRRLAQPARRGRRADRPARRPRSSRTRSRDRLAGDRRRPPLRRCSTAPTTASAALFDPVDGGFGSAPKFPPSMTIDFLLRRHVRGDDARDARRWSPRRSTRWPRAASTTTSAAASPGTPPTRVWLVPHFEKMLYDQALLVGAYLRGHLVTGHAALPRRSSRRRSGTCCATCATPTAASSPPRTPTREGVEGKFYLW